MFATIRRAFRKMDTSEVDAAIAEAKAGHRGVQVRARALRRDVSCGDPVGAVRALAEPVLQALAPRSPWDRAFKIDGHVPDDMQGLLRKL